MKTIILVRDDGARTLVGAPVADDFDVQAWAQSRRAAFALLLIVQIIVV